MKLDIGNIMENEIGTSTVGFVDFKDTGAQSLGSGTLVKLSKLGGIITCSHVLKQIMARDEIGIVHLSARPGMRQSNKLNLKNIADYVEVGNDNESEFGPNFAFLKLPPNVMADLEARAVAINWGKYPNIIRRDGPTEIYADVICGVIGERTGKPFERHPHIVTTPFNALLTPGRVSELKNANGYELAIFEPESTNEQPSNFGGTSGGGLWRIYLDKAEDGCSAVETWFLGVAFYQKERQIICHGPNTINGHLLQAVKRKWG